MRTGPVVDIASLAKFILSSDCKSIAILTGAGVSCASGIPDFRSPGGMYDTLRPELITASETQRQRMRIDPTEVVSYDMFQQTPYPYLEVRRPFILGTREKRWKATISHYFAELLHTKTNKLTRVYTQNIDGLDHQCDGIPSEKIVNVHGTISRAACEECGHDVDFGEFCDAVQHNIKDIYGIDKQAPKESSPISCPNCGKPTLKPVTVLFGRSLPSIFFERTREDLSSLDLLIIAGTSLVVSPANSLVYNVPKTTLRVVVNKDPVGTELGIEYNDANNKRDFFAQGNCDEVFFDLIKNLGWLDDLKARAKYLPEQSAQLL